MNHTDAQREMSVEKYLLGELTGTARDAFEEHLFECELCTADLHSSVVFAEAARQDLAAEAPAKLRVPVHTAEKTSGWFDWILRPQWMAPALGACLLLIGYQNVYKFPAVEQQLAAAQSPHVVSTLSMSSGAVRGGGVPHITAPAKGAFLLSVDMPPQSGYSGYVCSLYSPAGAVVWSGKVPLSEAGDTVSIHVPSASTQAGKNTLLVQGVRGGEGSGATLEDLARHDFILEFQK